METSIRIVDYHLKERIEGQNTITGRRKKHSKSHLRIPPTSLQWGDDLGVGDYWLKSA
jgi:hypothetical protein